MKKIAFLILLSFGLNAQTVPFKLIQKSTGTGSTVVTNTAGILTYTDVLSSSMIPTLSTYVPYTGATQSASLGVWNGYANNFVSKTIQITSAASVTSLTVLSERTQELIGALTHSFNLPNATTLVKGSLFEFNNNSSGNLFIRDYSGSALKTVTPGAYVQVICTNISSSSGQWDFHFMNPANSQYGTSGMLITGSLQTTSDLNVSGNSAITGKQQIGGTLAAPSASSLTVNGGIYTPTYLKADGSSTLNNVAYTGTLTTGALTFTDTNVLASFQSSVNGYNQIILQNSSTANNASADLVIGNNDMTSANKYMNVGKNSSTYTGTPIFNIAGAGYVYTQGVDLAIGTSSTNAIHLAANNATTDAITVSSSNTVAIPAKMNIGNAAVNSSSLGFVRIGQGTSIMDFGQSQGAFPTIWLQQSSPSTSNYAIAGDVNSTYINSPGSVIFSTGNSARFSVNSQGIKYQAAPTLTATNSCFRAASTSTNWIDIGEDNGASLGCIWGNQNSLVYNNSALFWNSSTTALNGSSTAKMTINGANVLVANSSGASLTGNLTVSGTSTMSGNVIIQRSIDGNVANLSINSGVANVNAFQIITDKTNSLVLLDARNSYSLGFQLNDVTVGTISSSGFITNNNISSSSKTGGVGYAVGSGSTVTQATSRTTGVTINSITGAITLVSAAGSATYQSFTVTNSAVAATDVVVVSQKSGTDLNIILVTAVAAGSFKISFATTGGTTTEQPVFNFAVIKGQTN